MRSRSAPRGALIDANWQEPPFASNMNSAPTQLLVSVRDVHEVEPALRGGADWIDLKDPAAGALGAVSAAVAREVVADVRGRCAVSAAAGELLDWPSGADRELLGVSGISYLKLGLAGCSHVERWKSLWCAAQQQISACGQRLVLAAYADASTAQAPAVHDVLAFAGRAKPEYFLLDTWNKSGRPLTGCFTPAELAASLAAVHAIGARTVVAGKLTPSEITALPLVAIDVVAVRGAACQGGRRGSVSAQRVRAVRQLLQSECKPPARSRSDQGPRARAGGAPAYPEDLLDTAR